MRAEPHPRAEQRRDADWYLQQFEQFYPKKIDLVLNRMTRLLRDLDNPQRAMPPAVHIAGTNGKGSVLALLRAMLEAAGERVHCYTSPHLVRFHERIRLHGKPIADAELVALLHHCLEKNRARPITFFEMTTAAAFLAFARAPAQRVLLEVGLGGRLDATNCATHIQCSVIGAIDHDHQEFLGSSLSAIAREKLGILRAGVPAFLGRNRASIVAQAKAQARRIGAPLKVLGEDFSWQRERSQWRWRDGRGALRLPLPALAGDHQLDNAALAVAVARQLGCSEASMARGLVEARWPGRLTPLRWQMPGGGELPFWLDGGHNPHAAEALARWAGEQRRPQQNVYLISAMMQRKPARRFFATFRALRPRAVALALPQHASYAAEALVGEMRAAGIKAEPAASLADAFAQIAAQEAAQKKPRAPQPLILVCGSLYLAGQVLTDFPQAMS